MYNLYKVVIKKILKTPQGIATIVALAVLALYPFSHFPLVPGFGISPFQFVSLPIAVFGAVAAVWWILRNQTIARSLDKGRERPLVWLALLFTWLAFSFLWGSRTTHELYYIGLVFASFSFALGMYALFRLGSLQTSFIAQIVIIAAVVLSVGAVWQFIGESIGVARAYTNICKTCLQHDIGVARSSGFSQEPEHFSTVLLGPLVLLLLILVGQKRGGRNLLLWLGVLSVVIALLLASSRSGLLAFAFVLLSFGGLAIYHRAKLFMIGLVGTCVAAMVLVLGLVAWSGTVGDAAGSKYTTERYTAHVSGGLVVFGDEQKRLADVEDSIKQKAEVKSSEAKDFNYVTDAVDYGPSGAVVYSAQSRIETYRTATAIWTQNLKNFVVGIGWGNFGAAAQVRDPAAFNKNTIVNNQYLQIAVELGLVGLVLFAVVVASAAQFVYRSALDAKAKIAIFVLFIAYGIQLLFYSGLHLLQFWLSLAIVSYVIYVTVRRRKSKSAKK